MLANYLKNEYPQTVAVVLSKIKPEHAARVLALLPEDFALEVVMRMLRMESGAEGSARRRRADACAPNSCPTWRAPPRATPTR